MTEEREKYVVAIGAEYSAEQLLDQLISVFLRQLDQIGYEVESGVLYPSNERFFVIRKQGPAA
jgi:hypothetical protein